jgi:hypothetical protein
MRCGNAWFTQKTLSIYSAQPTTSSIVAAASIAR